MGRPAAFVALLPLEAIRHRWMEVTMTEEVDSSM